jgi:hypothetical protein
MKKLKIMKKNCQYCNKEFTTNYDRKVYCDYTCSQKTQSEKGNNKRRTLRQYSNQQIIDEFMRRFFLCGDFYTKEDIITLYNLNNDFDFNDFKNSCQDNKSMLENAYDVMETLIVDYNHSLDN